jgi:hypothetical protein
MLGKSFKLIFNITNSRERKHVLGFKLLLTTAPSHHGFKLHALLSVHLTSKKLSMYNSHIGARKEKKKRRKISWAATAQVLAGGIAKSAHVCLLESLVLSKRKKRYLLSGATTKIWMPSLGLLSLSLAMACGHHHHAANAACLFLCGPMGLLLSLEVIQCPELLPEKPLQLWELIYRTAIWISVMVKCPCPINKKLCQ